MRSLLWAVALACALAACRGAAPEAAADDALTPTRTATWTPRPTWTATLAPTPTASPTATATATLTPTSTPTPLAIVTRTPSPRPTASSVPTLLPAPRQTAVAPEARYHIGGIHFDDPHAPLSMAYPASLEGEALTRFDDLEILVADVRGVQYERFVREYGGKVFVYPDTASGSFVLNVHDGVVLRTGRVLEAEPLRQLIEGDLHAPRPLAEIEARLEQLVGREFLFRQGDVTAQFRLVRGRRMGAADVAHYQDKASQLSTFVAPFPDPSRAFLLFFCSGRQPGEPAQTFAGRYVLVLGLVE